MAAVKAGVGREIAHEAIKEHAVIVALELREKAVEGNDLLDRLATDSRLRLARADLDAIVADPLSFTGAAAAQVHAFVQQVDNVVQRYPDAASYEPEPIL
jgi:adenylosuccinate lyase